MKFIVACRGHMSRSNDLGYCHAGHYPVARLPPACATNVLDPSSCIVRGSNIDGEGRYLGGYIASES